METKDVKSVSDMAIAHSQDPYGSNVGYPSKGVYSSPLYDAVCDIVSLECMRLLSAKTRKGDIGFVESLDIRNHVYGNDFNANAKNHILMHWMYRLGIILKTQMPDPGHRDSHTCKTDTLGQIQVLESAINTVRSTVAIKVGTIERSADPLGPIMPTQTPWRTMSATNGVMPAERQERVVGFMNEFLLSLKDVKERWTSYMPTAQLQFITIGEEEETKEIDRPQKIDPPLTILEKLFRRIRFWR